MTDGAACETFERALAHHRAGRVHDAEQLYREVVRGQADHAGALHLLGVAALSGGRFPEALDWLRRAIAVDPHVAVYSLSLAQALTVLGHLDEAIVANQRAIELAPDMVEGWFALGISLQSAGQRREAVQAYRVRSKLLPIMRTQPTISAGPSISWETWTRQSSPIEGPSSTIPHG